MSQPHIVGVADVHYFPTQGARAALIVGSDVQFSQITSEHVAQVDHVAPYEPGRLYLRELPCLQAVLSLAPALELLIVDGYSTLDPHGRPGLGAHASAAFGIPVIGVAKAPFQGATHALEVHRGKAVRPLYVTASHLDIQRAAALVANMYGKSRLPDAIRMADRLARRGMVDLNDTPDTPARETTRITGPRDSQ